MNSDDLLVPGVSSKIATLKIEDRQGKKPYYVMRLGPGENYFAIDMKDDTLKRYDYNSLCTLLQTGPYNLLLQPCVDHETRIVIVPSHFLKNKRNKPQSDWQNNLLLLESFDDFKRNKNTDVVFKELHEVLHGSNAPQDKGKSRTNYWLKKTPTRKQIISYNAKHGAELMKDNYGVDFYEFPNNVEQPLVDSSKYKRVDYPPNFTFDATLKRGHFTKKSSSSNDDSSSSNSDSDSDSNSNSNSSEFGSTSESEYEYSS